MNSKFLRAQFRNEMRTCYHAGMLTDPAEDNVMQACSRVVAQWCREIRFSLRQNAKLNITSVLFFSYHPEFNLMLSWPANDSVQSADVGPDFVLSSPAKVSHLRFRSRLVPKINFAGLSSLMLDRDNPSAVYLLPERTHLVFNHGEWTTRDARRSLDPKSSDKLGIQDRVYLPIGPYPRKGKGAFLVAIDPKEFGARDLRKTKEIAERVVRAFREYTNDQYVRNSLLVSTEMVEALWYQLWHAARENKTLLPHQGSFKRVLARVLDPTFFENQRPYVGVMHFDFNSFKRLNELIGYDGADRMIEEFVRHSCKHLADLAAPWKDPISTTAGGWPRLQQYAKKPGLAWYFSRVGGDEFGLIVVSSFPIMNEVQRVLRRALGKTARATKNWRRLKSQWNPQCMGACVEDRASRLTRPDLDYAEQAEAIWNDVAAASQHIKAEYKHLVRQSPFYCRQVKYLKLQDHQLIFGKGRPFCVLRPHPSFWRGDMLSLQDVQFLPASMVRIVRESKVAIVKRA